MSVPVTGDFVLVAYVQYELGLSISKVDFAPADASPVELGSSGRCIGSIIRNMSGVLRHGVIGGPVHALRCCGGGWRPARCSLHASCPVVSVPVSNCCAGSWKKSNVVYVTRGIRSYCSSHTDEVQVRSPWRCNA